MNYKFGRIEGKPPKKDGASSMWSKDSEVKRLIALRERAYEFYKKGKVLNNNIKLTLKVHLKKNGRRVGDLDNFIAGICDGLMFAHDNKELKISRNFPEHIHPRKFRLIEDDYLIVKIIAEKKKSDEEYYEVELEEI